MKFITLLILVLIYSIFNYKKFSNNFNKELLQNTNYSSLRNIPKIVNSIKIEIFNLPIIRPEFNFRFKCNTNILFNDGREVYQNSERHFKNKVLIDGYLFRLSKISFTKSIFSWKGQAIGLELRIKNITADHRKVIEFIIPLSLVDVRFNNVLKTEELNAINTLISRSDQIPGFICCQPTFGKIIKFDLYNLANLLNKQEFFYKYDMDDNYIFYITNPIQFDREIGLNIINKLL